MRQDGKFRRQPRFASVSSMCVSQAPERTRPARKRSDWPSWKRTSSAATARRSGVPSAPHSAITWFSSGVCGASPAARRFNAAP